MQWWHLRNRAPINWWHCFPTSSDPSYDNFRQVKFYNSRKIETKWRPRLPNLDGFTTTSFEGTKGSHNWDLVNVLFGSDLVTICQQGCCSLRHDLVLVGDENPTLEADVGWKFGGMPLLQDGNARVEATDLSWRFLWMTRKEHRPSCFRTLPSWWSPKRSDWATNGKR